MLTDGLSKALVELNLQSLDQEIRSEVLLLLACSSPRVAFELGFGDATLQRFDLFLKAHDGSPVDLEDSSDRTADAERAAHGPLASRGH
jgi:hypothetical protein